MAKDFICPYSGASQDIVFMEGNPSGYCLVGGFDPALPFLEAEDGEAAFRMRGGVRNAVDTPSCPYTGSEVRFTYNRGLWWPQGNIFQPFGRWRHKSELAWAAQMRDGVPPDGAKPYYPKVEVVGEVEPPVADDTVSVEVDEELIEDVLKGKKGGKKK